MKTFLYAGTGLIAVLLIVFLSLSKPAGNKIAEQSTAIASQTPFVPTHAPANPIATPTQTLSPRQQIVAEERQLAAEYDQAVKAEMQKGQVETSIDPNAGKEIVRFTGTSYETIAKLYDDFSQKLQTLNQRYLALYIAEVQPTPFPTRSTEKENEDYYHELLAQYPAFFRPAAQ